MRLLISSFTLLLTFFSSVVYSQEIKWQKTGDQCLPIPPDGIWLQDNLFIDATEVANIHWLEFVRHTSNTDSLTDYNPYSGELGWNGLSDSLLYIRNGEFGYSINPFGFQYCEQDLLLRYHPIVGVSYRQVQAYSEWRGQVVTRLLNQRLERLGDTLRVVCYYRLPTEQEWEQAAKSTQSYADSLLFFTKKASRHLNREMRANGMHQLDWQKISYPSFVCGFPLLSSQDSLSIYLEGVNMLGDTRRGFANTLGIYHLMGNVAEMTQTQGIAKGGSWMHKAEECHINDVQTYSCPSEWLGFRNICEVQVYHKDSIPPMLERGYVQAPITCDWILEKEYWRKVEGNVSLQKEEFIRAFERDNDKRVIGLKSCSPIGTTDNRADSISMTKRLQFCYTLPDSIQPDTIYTYLTDWKCSRVYQSTSYTAINNALKGEIQLADRTGLLVLLIEIKESSKKKSLWSFQFIEGS